MKKIFLFILLFLFFPAVAEYKHCGMENKNACIAHVYIDLATIPSLFQMVDAVQRNEEDPKIFFWKRFPALESDNRLLKEMNAQMISCDFLGEFDYDEFNDLIDLHLKKFYEQYPDYQYVIHLSAYHALERSGHFFDIIPEGQIKSIHLYDDSIGHSLWEEANYISYKEFSKKFETYFHVAYYDPKVLPIEKEKIIPMDISVKLSNDQRKKIMVLTGLNIDEIAPLFEHKPVAVFLDDPNLEPETAEKFIEKLIKTNPEVRNYTWLYKNHPRVNFSGDVLDILKQHFEIVIIIPNFIPLETFILIGLSPDYIAGYGSSVFYSFKKEQILGYIKRRKYETYMSFLLDLGILTPDMIFE